MTTYVEIPTEPGGPFSERLTIRDAVYTLRFQWNVRAQFWTVEFWDAGNEEKVLCGVPLVTGSDLLEQFLYLPLGRYSILIVVTTGPAKSPDSIPNFTNLGIDGHLYLLTADPEDQEA